MELSIKTVGQIRRMDDLGRIVIPKECRRAIGLTSPNNWSTIGEGEAFEVFAVEDGFYVKYRKDLKENA
jgi:bifunctional DNA-binding transcriptional regulator/antitoxin component of YhaV-PrlF toxin-antitoxin module